MSTPTQSQDSQFSRDALLVRLMKALLPLLKEEDSRERRVAMWLMSRIPNTDRILWNQCYTLYVQTRDIGDGAVPTDTPEERELIKKVHDGAVKWLEKNEK